MMSKGVFNEMVCMWIESKDKNLKVHDISDTHINELYVKIFGEA